MRVGWNLSPFPEFLEIKTLDMQRRSTVIFLLDSVCFLRNSNYTEPGPKNLLQLYKLVVSTPLKNISQNGNLPQLGVKIKHI